MAACAVFRRLASTPKSACLHTHTANALFCTVPTALPHFATSTHTHVLGELERYCFLASHTNCSNTHCAGQATYDALSLPNAGRLWWAVCLRSVVGLHCWLRALQPPSFVRVCCDSGGMVLLQCLVVRVCAVLVLCDEQPQG